MKKISQVLFITLIVLLLFFPFVFAHREENRIAEGENRYYANVPDLFIDGNINTNYIPEFENWIADNARLRTIFRKMKVELLYKVFGVLDLENTGIGTNNELYTTSENTVDTVQGRNKFSEEELQNHENMIYNLQEWLKEQSVDFYYMICHDKSTVLSEYYPRNVVSYDDGYVGRETEQYIMEQGRVNIIPLYDMLKNAAADEKVYYEYWDSFHWNEAGVFLGYRELMDKINEKHPEITPLQKNDYDIVYMPAQRDVYGFLYPFTEEMPSYRIKNSQAELTETPLYNELRSKDKVYYYENPNGNKRILTVSDSFVQMFMKSSIAESFRETLSIDISNIDKIAWLIEEYQPDIVLLECEELNLHKVDGMLRQTQWK